MKHTGETFPSGCCVFSTVCGFGQEFSTAWSVQFAYGLPTGSNGTVTCAGTVFPYKSRTNRHHAEYKTETDIRCMKIECKCFKYFLVFGEKNLTLPKFMPFRRHTLTGKKQYSIITLWNNSCPASYPLPHFEISKQGSVPYSVFLVEPGQIMLCNKDIRVSETFGDIRYINPFTLQDTCK